MLDNIEFYGTIESYKEESDMQYEKLLLEMFERLAALEKKVAALEDVQKSGNSLGSNIQKINGSKKYRFLSRYLLERQELLVKLSFTEIEDIVQFPLPDSAKKHKEFWANTTSHSIALSWLSVNFKTVEVNIDDEYVVFEKNDTKYTAKDNYLRENNMGYEYEWNRKKGYLVSEIIKVFNNLKNTVELDHLTYQKQYIGVNIGGINRALIKFRPKKDSFFLEVYDKTHTGDKLTQLQEKGVPIMYLDDPKDKPKMYYYRIELKDFQQYCTHEDAICSLVKYCYHLSV